MQNIHELFDTLSFHSTGATPQYPAGQIVDSTETVSLHPKGQNDISVPNVDANITIDYSQTKLELGSDNVDLVYQAICKIRQVLASSSMPYEVHFNILF